jgi:endonuclease YncB( thermonuclease family)
VPADFERASLVGFSFRKITKCLPSYLVVNRYILSFTSAYHPIGIRAPRAARSASEKSEPYGNEAAEFATRRYMQRDVEIEIETTDKSGGFIGALYLNKNENAAVTLISEGLATVHSFSADSLSWSKQLYDAEVGHCAALQREQCLTLPSQEEAKKARRNVSLYPCFCHGRLPTCSSDLV